MEMANEPPSEAGSAFNGTPAAAATVNANLRPEGDAEQLDLGVLRQVPMTMHVEVGRATMTLGEILDELRVGSSIRLDRHAGDPVEVYVNGALFARAEVVVMQDQIGAKIVELIDAPGMQRPAGLRSTFSGAAQTGSTAD
jgi:flagellar motor switch protein FliN